MTTEEQSGVTVFACGAPKTCPKGDEHQWDGPGIEWNTGESATCSKCGVDALSVSLWNDE